MALRLKHILLLLPLGVILALSPPANSVAVYPLSEIHPGLKGRAWTVLKGEKVEPLSTEIEGVVDMGPPQGRLLLASIRNPALDGLGIPAGMSGSPVYAEDGRWIGAVAYSWGFLSETKTLITPAENMLKWLERDHPTGAGPAVGTASSLFQALITPMPLTFSHSAPLAGIEIPKPKWVLSRNGKENGPPVASPSVSPGEMVAVCLVDGDVTLAAFGTISARKDNRLLLFGHSFLGENGLRMPLRKASVLGIIPSRQNPFKLSTVGSPLGQVLDESPWGLKATLSPNIHEGMIQVDLTLEWMGKDTAYRVWIPTHPYLSGPILGYLLDNLGSTTFPQGQSIQVQTSGTITLKGGMVVPLPPGAQSGIEAWNHTVIETVGLVGYLQNNVFESKVPTHIAARFSAKPSSPNRRIIPPQLRSTIRAGSSFTATLKTLGGTLPPLTLTAPSQWEGPLTLLVGEPLDMASRLSKLRGSHPHTLEEAIAPLRDLPNGSALSWALVGRKIRTSLPSHASSKNLPHRVVFSQGSIPIPHPISGTAVASLEIIP